MCNKCGYNNCGCYNEYIVSIARDNMDQSIIRSISNKGNITDWHDGQIRSVSVQAGKIIVDVINGPNEIIDGEDLEFDYLKSIKVNDNGSISVENSEGLITTIPVGFPDRVIYEKDNTFTLATNDGQRLEVNVLEAVGSYVSCIHRDCDGNVVFEIESNGECDSCASENFVIPIEDLSEDDPVYRSEKPTLAKNSEHNNGIVRLNNGDGTTILTYTLSKINQMIDDVSFNVNETDPVYMADKVNLEKNHVENTSTGVVTLTTGHNNITTVYNKNKLDTKFNEILAKFQSLILTDSNPGPVSMTGSPVKIIEFNPITNPGAYKGAFRATYDGKGTRNVTVRVYKNGIATGRETTYSVTDNLTVTHQTVTPIDLIEGDIVAVYVTIQSGTVVDADGILELAIASGGTINLTGLEKDHTETNGVVTLTNSGNGTSNVYSTSKTDELLDARLDRADGDNLYERAYSVNKSMTNDDILDMNMAEIISLVRSNYANGTYASVAVGYGASNNLPALKTAMINLVNEMYGTNYADDADNSCNFRFESSIGGGLTGNQVLSIGINGKGMFYFQYDNWGLNYTNTNTDAFRKLESWIGYTHAYEVDVTRGVSTFGGYNNGGTSVTDGLFTDGDLGVKGLIYNSTADTPVVVNDILEVRGDVKVPSNGILVKGGYGQGGTTISTDIFTDGDLGVRGRIYNSLTGQPIHIDDDLKVDGALDLNGSVDITNGVTLHSLLSSEGASYSGGINYIRLDSAGSTTLVNHRLLYLRHPSSGNEFFHLSFNRGTAEADNIVFSGKSLSTGESYVGARFNSGASAYDYGVKKYFAYASSSKAQQIASIEREITLQEQIDELKSKDLLRDAQMEAIINGETIPTTLKQPKVASAELQALQAKLEQAQVELEEQLYIDEVTVVEDSIKNLKELEAKNKTGDVDPRIQGLEEKLLEIKQRYGKEV